MMDGGMGIFALFTVLALLGWMAFLAHKLRDNYISPPALIAASTATVAGVLVGLVELEWHTPLGIPAGDISFTVMVLALSYSVAAVLWYFQCRYG